MGKLLDFLNGTTIHPNLLFKFEKEPVLSSALDFGSSVKISGKKYYKGNIVINNLCSPYILHDKVYILLRVRYNKKVGGDPECLHDLLDNIPTLIVENKNNSKVYFINIKDLLQNNINDIYSKIDHFEDNVTIKHLFIHFKYSDPNEILVQNPVEGYLCFPDYAVSKSFRKYIYDLI